MQIQTQKAPFLLLIAALTIPAWGALEPAWASQAPPGREFEFQVRELVFRGLDGDTVALEEALAICSEALEADENDAQALVWHGSTSLALAGVAYESGKFASGGMLWQRGLAEMERAVALEPDNIAVLIPRAATLLGAAPNVPFPEQSQELTRIAVGDYEQVYERQRVYFDRMSEHARGELLLGLADGHHRLGNRPDVERYMRLIREELPGTAYAEEAESYLSADPASASLTVRTCQGCHR